MLLTGTYKADIYQYLFSGPAEIEWNEDLDENSDWILDRANSSTKTVYKDIPTYRAGNGSTVSVYVYALNFFKKYNHTPD